MSRPAARRRFRRRVLTRFILSRLVVLAAAVVVVAIILWVLHGGLARSLAGGAAADPVDLVRRSARALWEPVVLVGTELLSTALGATLSAAALLIAALLATLRALARRRRRYVRLRLLAYRTDESSVEGLVAMFESLHKRLLRPGWRRALTGQPSLALEVHCRAACSGEQSEGARAWLAVCAPAGSERALETALRGAYPNCSLEPAGVSLGSPPCLLRLRKHAIFIKRAKVLDRYEHERCPPMNRLITTMGSCEGPTYVQLALTPARAAFERRAERAYKRHERRTSRRPDTPLGPSRSSLYDETELKGGLSLQHRPLFFADLRVVAGDLASARRVASELRAQGAENRLVERRTRARPGPLCTHGHLARGEGGVLPPLYKGVFAPSELAALWHLPSVDYGTVPFARATVPVAPAPPAIHRPAEGDGLLRDALGPVSIHESSRRGNVAVPGAVEQGKSSFLVATIAEDLRRSRCAVIVLDPKGDAADAALSVVPPQRTCTLLDFSHPTCGFNPLATSAAPDVVADYVVAALRNLFSEADIRASSDRYLRNAIIAVLAHDRDATLWDAARMLSVGPEGAAFRARVAASVRGMPELKEVSEFFAAELSTQLADATSSTTAKLDAPANKLARLLNSPSIKRVLLNQHLAVDFDRVITRCEVLVVKGALGTMGQGNTAVLMQMLVGMLDAALARQQDLLSPDRRVAVALKIDEAPLVVNRGFAETMALKRSAGLETVACWQADSQWTDREIREQLDALFAHRIYFATASVRDARASASLMMAEFSDAVRPGVRNLSVLGRPDARLHLPKHHAIASLTTPEGRQRPFVGRTIPLRVDRGRIATHAQRQARRGARYLDDLRQPHWEQRDPAAEPAQAGRERAAPTTRTSTSPRDRAATAPPSYQELVSVDGASSLRILPLVSPAARAEPDARDIRVLALIATLRYVLSTQVHRRFDGSRARTTTQRRLKRLAEAGLLARIQFHRRDGAGTPICYAITGSGIAALTHAGWVPAGADDRGELVAPELPGSADDRGRVTQVRRELHVAGWVLALERALARGLLPLRGPHGSAISPPTRTTRAGPVALGPRELRLAGGRTPHDFWRTTAAGERLEVERFETVRPDARVELPEAGDLLVERDDRLPLGADARKLERYDHLVSGWAMQTRRHGMRLGTPPLVVFVCRDAARARECARRADGVLVACQAYPGEYPENWVYPGRSRILFAAERDAHEGSLRAYGVHPLPPDVRASSARADPHAREATPEPRAIASHEHAVS
jgi:hypothetical protein